MRAAFSVSVVLTGCTMAATSDVEQHAVSATVKQERAALIRDSAAEMGLYNAALLGGIATSETNFAHCWEEAQFACMGPASSSCGGGPIIAGSADGPCSNEQGGLGMFQFDAGTYSQTVATYGDSVLTVEGNTAQAVAFVVDKVIRDVDGIEDWNAAVAWINAVPLVAGDAVTEEWAHLLACRYNGCCANTAGCNSRAAEYRDNAIELYDEFGAEFWRTSDRCAGIPDDGVIDQRTECFVAGGEPRFWRHETGGFGDDYEWTKSTAGQAPANFAQWLLHPTRATTYRIEVYVEAGEATTANYQIVHAGQTSTVTIDQTTAAGFVALGEFELAADGTERVVLGDNTGLSGQKLVVDALRITALDGAGSGNPDDPEPRGDGDGGGCTTGGGGGAGWLALAAVGLVLRRRRRF